MREPVCAMESVRTYFLEYPGADPCICVTDTENSILHPAGKSTHVLAVYGDGAILDFECRRSALPVGSKVVMLRHSHLESCQLIHPDSRHVATVHRVYTMPRDEYEKIVKSHNNLTRMHTGAATRIRARITRKMESAQRKLKAEEKRAIEKLGEELSLDEMLEKHITTKEQA